jgi:hypothetical protein
MAATFDRAWAYLEPAAAEWKEHNRESVLAAVTERRAKLWTLDDGAALTRIRTFPTGRRSTIVWLAGGDLKEIVEWSSGPVEEHARANNCDDIRFIGRRGFLRAVGNCRELGAVVIRELGND